MLNLRRSVKISSSIQHMMMFSGLRGAIAFALAIRNTITESRQMILSTTLLIVISTVIINGGCSMAVLKYLGIPTGLLEDQNEQEPIVNSPLHPGYQNLEEGGHTPASSRQASQTIQKPEKSWLARRWAGADSKFFKPLLTHSYPTLMDTLPNKCLPLGRVFTSKEQFLKHPMMKEREREESSSSVTDCEG